MNPNEENCIVQVPDDLLEDILLRVRVRDLLGFRCVSKQWRTLIDGSNFVTKHYQFQHSICKGDGNMPHFVNHGGLTVSDLDYFGLVYIQKQGVVITSDLRVDLERDSKDVLVCNRDQFAVISLGCVNGIICLNWQSKIPSLIGGFLSLWNPATRDFKAVQYPNMPDLIHRTRFHIDGFGFDPMSNDFKIVGSYGILTPSYELFYEIYSLRTNCWKRHTEPPANVDGLSMPLTDGYLNGVYYWTAKLEHESGHLVIISFNFSLEVFDVSDPPQDAAALLASQMYPPFETKVALYKESVALFVTNQVGEEPLYKIDMWVVTQFNEHGAPSSWQHLLTVEPVHAKLGVRVATSRIDGDLLLKFMFPIEQENLAVCGCDDEDSECSLYNPLTKEFRKLGIDFSTWFRYVESLFPLSFVS